MPPQTALHQSELRRHLHDLTSRKFEFPKFGCSVANSHLRNSSFADMCPETSRDVNAFKGTLLGVEDELIDALLHVAYSSHASSPIPLESAAGQQRHTNEIWSERPLGIEEELIDALASFSEQDSDASVNPQTSGSPLFSPPHLALESAGHERHSRMYNKNTPQPVWNPWVVETKDDNFGSDNGRGESSFLCGASAATMPHLESSRSSPTTPSSHSPSPSMDSFDAPEADTTPVDPDDLVVDSIILERPGSLSLLSTWDVNDWQGTMSDLLAV